MMLMNDGMAWLEPGRLGLHRLFSWAEWVT
jgi:hypothetical protein